MKPPIKFDPNDEATWPKEDDIHYLIFFVQGGWAQGQWSMDYKCWWANGFTAPSQTVTHYMIPEPPTDEPSSTDSGRPRTMIMKAPEGYVLVPRELSEEQIEWLQSFTRPSNLDYYRWKHPHKIWDGIINQFEQKAKR